MNYKIFGYGTFITNKWYKSSSNVQPAFLPNYFRIYLPNESFPFILKDSGTNQKYKSGFWGLLFQVDSNGLSNLDKYEGLGNLYDRIEEYIILKNGDQVKCYLYYPTRKTIESLNLYDLIELGDGWRTKIIDEYPEIIEEFPELKKTDF
jgi:gamma-glutamylcyclotransferase (GGCT)/AIG2-like uncharacterized protein YtfP